jgi:hypothetical protein
MNAHEVETILKEKMAIYLPKAIAWAKKAEVVVEMLHTNKAALAIEAVIPGHKAILDAIDRVIPLEELILKKLPMVNYAFAAYDIYEGLGGKAMNYGGTIADLTKSGQLATQLGFDERDRGG